MKIIVATALALALMLPLSASPYEVRSLSEQQATDYQLDPVFFKKATVVHDMLIATSEGVSDFAHLETAWIFDNIMKNLHHDVAKRIRERRMLCIIAAHNEFTSDIPQFRTDKTGSDLAFYNWRKRGFVRNVDDRMIVFFTEEDVMHYEGGMRLESIAVHEFGNVINSVGLDEEQRAQLSRTYEQAKQKGLYNDGRAALRFRRIKGNQPVSLLEAIVGAFPDRSPDFLKRCLDEGDILVNGVPTNAAIRVTGNDEVLIMFGGEKACYAIRNDDGYFAEGFQNWFDTNRTMDHDHNHIHTRGQLRTYDSAFAAYLENILGNGSWRFTSPRDRAGKAHLAGYDPATAPVIEHSEFIQNAGLDYYDEYWAPYWERLEKKHADATEQSQ